MSPLHRLAERLACLGVHPFPAPAYEIGLYQLSEAAFQWLGKLTDEQITQLLFSKSPPDLSQHALEAYIEIHDGVVGWSELCDYV